MLNYRPLLPSGFMRELENRNGGEEDEQESIFSFLKNLTFIHLVIFIYKNFKFLILILLLQFPSIRSFESFCGFGNHPHTVDISLRYHRFLINALYTQASAETTYAVPAALATPSVQLCYQLIFIALGYAQLQACGLPYMR